jgi:hypothetical protein
MNAQRSGASTFTPPEGLRLIFVAMIGVWLLFPIVVRQNMAQDAIPYVVAGELTHDHPETVYPAKSGDLYDLDPLFARRSCEVAPAGSDCSLNVAYVSTPLALPLAVTASKLGGDGGVLLLRLLGAASLSGGMWILWTRLAHRTPRSPQLLVATAVLLTPFAMAPIALGQTSEVLFLSACLGVSSTRRGRVILASGVWVATVALKAFPAVLVLLLVWQRRWRMLAWSVAWTALLAALTALAGPASLWTDFVKGSGRLAGQSNWNAYNGSLDSLVHNLVPSVTDNRSTTLLLTAVRIVLAGALFWWGARRADHDSQWAVAFLAALFIVPFVWWHYLWLAVAAVGITLAGRARLDDRAVTVLPILALITVPFSILNGQGQPAPVAQAAFLLAAAGVAAALARGVLLPAGDRPTTRLPA